MKRSCKPRPWFDENTNEIYLGESMFSFWNFIKPPKKAIDSGEYFGKNGFSGGVHYGNTEYNWYNWNNANWDTKWDCGEVSIEEYDDSVSINFNTAWADPRPVFIAMTEQYPNLSFYFEWEEEQGWGGEATGNKGVFEIDREWGIPESHADMRYINKGDCVCEYRDNEEDWFADCKQAKLAEGKVYEIV